MPRNPHAAASTLRNRNRITNKTRLKIHQGSLDADAVLIPDEDEEKHRLTNLVAGVDAEDANEHHLQEVLSAAHRNQLNNRAARAGAPEKLAATFIPTPDSTGIVENYPELYPANKWKDPSTFVHSSQTTEEYITDGIANGFTYYMDERDKEWLDKNNEEARGEGTSAQGAVSTSGTRTSARSAKAKGKEPESSTPIIISEDEFELVMGTFEKITYERTEFLHHSLETGMDFPAFTDYQDVFSTSLPPNMFATYTVPSWIPSPSALSKIAKAIYPYWKERRIERGGQRIIPTLNFDESDTLNESYVCFRRRETKAVRKTRASQVTSSDKLARLQMEFSYPLELAKTILQRETVKKQAFTESQSIWEHRLALVELRRKFPSLGDKSDEELLIDKEKPAKKSEVSSRVPGLKIRTGDAVIPPPRQEVAIRPKDRLQAINQQVEAIMARQKELDYPWEDQVDNGYQALPVPYASKQFKFISPPDSPPWPSPISDKADEETKSTRSSLPARAARLRIGRGGLYHIDRRTSAARHFLKLPKSSLFGLAEDDEPLSQPMDVDEDPEEIERIRRLEERWRFDSDDSPSIGPDGADEQDRALIDDYNPTYLRHIMTLYKDTDHMSLMNDPSVILTGPEGRPQKLVPYRLGMQNAAMMVKKDSQGILRAFPASVPIAQLTPNHPMAIAASGTPVATQHQIKKMSIPMAGPQMRISSNGGMRPPSIPLSNLQTNGATPLHVSPPHPVPVPVPVHASPNGVNGTSRAAISMPHVDVQKLPEAVATATPAITNGVTPIPQPEANAEATINGTPTRPKSQNITPPSNLALGVPTTGYHLTPMTNLTTNGLVNAGTFQHGQNQPQVPAGLSVQQLHTLKTAFAGVNGAHDLATLQARGLPMSYMNNLNMQIPQAANMNLKLPAARQMQWLNSPMPRPNSGMDGQVNGTSPNLNASIPVRSASAAGMRPIPPMRNGLVNGTHSMSPMQHSPSPLPNISQSQSPPRVPMTPNMGMASPSLQQQQPVGAPQNGY